MIDMCILIAYDFLSSRKRKKKDKNQGRILWPAYSGRKGKTATTQSSALKRRRR